MGPKGDKKNTASKKSTNKVQEDKKRNVKEIEKQGKTTRSGQSNKNKVASESYIALADMDIDQSKKLADSDSFVTPESQTT